MTAYEFYKREREIQEEQLKKAVRKLNVSSLLRLLIFLAVAGGIWYFFDTWQFAAVIGIIGIAVFLFLVSRHSDLKYERDRIRELIDINENELKVLNRDFRHLPTGNEFESPLHPYSQDIDLFGKGSFFQFLNRTALQEGKERLSRLLTENTTDKIPEKQEAVRDLAEKARWRQQFSAVASLAKTEVSSAQVVDWITHYKGFVPGYIKWLPWLVTLISLVLITGFFLDRVTGIQLFLWFLAGWFFTGIYIKKINLLSSGVSKAQDTIHQYYKLLELIENEDFSSRILVEKQEEIRSGAKSSSAILRNFSRAIDSLDQRNNMIFLAVGNGFLLWDLRQSYRIEKWILQHQDDVKAWFEAIEFTDAFNSLGNFAFNHPSYVFPEIEKGEHIVKARSLAHPLLNPEKRVANDVEIKKEEFFVITGANMAGKSTFLRTVSLQIVMANTGLPVCAASCSYNPVKLITSMRTTDSLSDDESYFFSELKRLQFIVRAIKENADYFIILDEILKGTNSTDKAIGSKKFIRKLVKSGSTGIIATHDLSLCETSAELPQVKNYYFDAEIVNDQLHFDYKFKTGVCQNMNASFLLKKMNIVD